MKKLIYYITDHGKGHATRSVALIRKLQNHGIIVIVRNSNAIDFLQNSLPGIEIKEGLTDIGPILNPDGISINHDESINKISYWIENINDFSDKEMEFLKSQKPDIIISDVSPMPLIAASSLNIPSIIISNFSWYDVLTFLPDNLRLKLKQFYELADLCLQLPLGTKMEHFKRKHKIPLIARSPTKTTDEIRKEFSIKKSSPCILFALGGSENQISFSYTDDIQIVSLNTNFKKSIRKIDLSNTTEGQNLVSIADLVICKCGYGLISECLSNGTSFFYLANENHPEQMAISDELTKKGYDNRISFNEISELYFSQEFLQNIKKITREPVSFDDTINYILKLMKN